MECQLEAHPVPDITWYQGEKSVVGSNRIKMSRKAVSKDTYVLTLEISNPTRDDGGNYRCNAFNIYGESNANIALNFQGTNIYIYQKSRFDASIVSKNPVQNIRSIDFRCNYSIDLGSLVPHLLQLLYIHTHSYTHTNFFLLQFLWLFPFHLKSFRISLLFRSSD